MKKKSIWAFAETIYENTAYFKSGPALVSHGGLGERTGKSLCKRLHKVSFGEGFFVHSLVMWPLFTLCMGEVLICFTRMRDVSCSLLFWFSFLNVFSALFSVQMMSK